MNLRNWATLLLLAALVIGYYFISALDTSGMEKHDFSARELGFWKVQGAADVQVKANGLLQLDEKNAGEGVALENPSEQEGDWIFSFEVLPLSAATALSAKFFDGDEDYTFNIKTDTLNRPRSISRNGEDLSLKDDKDGNFTLRRLDCWRALFQNEIALNKFYKIDLVKKGTKLVLFIDGEKTAATEDKQPLTKGKLSLRIHGLKNHPAGIVLRNAALYLPIQP